MCASLVGCRILLDEVFSRHLVVVIVLLLLPPPKVRVECGASAHSLEQSERRRGVTLAWYDKTRMVRPRKGRKQGNLEIKKSVG